MPCTAVYARLVLSYVPLRWSTWEPGQSLGLVRKSFLGVGEEGVNWAFLYSGWIKSKTHTELAKENSKYIVAKEKKIWINSWYRCQQSGKIHEDTAFIARCCQGLRVTTAWVEQGRRGHFEAPCLYQEQEVKPQGCYSRFLSVFSSGSLWLPIYLFWTLPFFRIWEALYSFEWPRWLAQLLRVWSYGKQVSRWHFHMSLWTWPTGSASQVLGLPHCLSVAGWWICAMQSLQHGWRIHSPAGRPPC